MTGFDTVKDLLDLKCSYVLLRDKERAQIIRKFSEIYHRGIDDVDEGSELDYILSTVMTDPEFQKLLDKFDIDSIEVEVDENGIEVIVDRDLEKFGPYNADVVVDGSLSKLGRLASQVANFAQEGYKVAVVNAEEIVRTGSEDYLLADYRKKRGIGSDSGPVYPKRPDKIVKRSIRGMLPHKKERGRHALSNIRVYLGNPFQGKGWMLNEKKPTDVYSTKKFMTIGEIAQKLGWEN